jgi:hypothetical protein
LVTQQDCSCAERADRIGAVLITTASLSVTVVISPYHK